MDKSSKFSLPVEGLNGIAKSREFNWYVDEPLELGGTNLAPTPKELAFGALASCIAITLRMYCERKNWNTGTIDVDIFQKEEEVHSYIIHKKITFGNKTLTQEQIDKLMFISNKCPVSKLFLKESKIIQEQG